MKSGSVQSKTHFLAESVAKETPSEIRNLGGKIRTNCEYLHIKKALEILIEGECTVEDMKGISEYLDQIKPSF